MRLASAAAAISVAAATPAALAQALSFTRYTNATGATNPTSGFSTSNNVNDVYASGNSIYAGTNAGLSISTTRGTTWTTSPGLVEQVTSVYAIVNSNPAQTSIYAGGPSSLNISPNGGQNWTRITSYAALGVSGVTSAPIVRSVFAIGNTIYAGLGASRGLSFSKDNGRHREGRL